MAEWRVVNSGGIWLSGLLTAVFVCAKVFGWQPVAAWSWFWVLSPLWIEMAVILGIALLAFLGIGIYALIVTLTDKKAKKRYTFKSVHRGKF